jgi:REP element-mobilizing transposase RayT
MVYSYNPNIHHRKSIRLRGYDYSSSGLYYITICTNEKKCLFGKIVPLADKKNRHEMTLNTAGKIADSCWLMIPEHFPNAFLHEYVVMPNHVHGIIELRKKSGGHVGVENFQQLRNEYQKIIPHSIGSIVRGFKIGVTKWFRNNTDIKKLWERNYYEHIIRNDGSYEQIANYILENPSHWETDDFYSCS